MDKGVKLKIKNNKIDETKKEEFRTSIPEDISPADLTKETLTDILETMAKGPTPICQHPETKENIFCLIGRYGPYLQLGEVTEEHPKPKRASIPKNIEYRSISMEDAVILLSLPRELGNHPETNLPILANRGRFGPYVMHNGEFR